MPLSSLTFVVAFAIPQEPPPTWSSEIAGMIHSHCAECHRPGEAGPFSLLEFGDVKKRARMLETVMEDGYMPPWHPVAGHGEFLGQRGISPAELELISRKGVLQTCRRRTRRIWRLRS